MTLAISIFMISPRLIFFILFSQIQTSDVSIKIENIL